MKYNPEINHRRSIRLKKYDYAWAGAYFVTVCIRKRECLLGDMADDKIWLNDAGRMVQVVWDELPAHYPGMETDAFVVMPNHVHGVIVLVGAGPRACPEFDGQPQGVAPTILSLSDLLHRFKTMTTKRYADGVKQTGWKPFPGKLWQRNYYEHIIRNEKSLNSTREYIINNPAQWEFDRENPASADMKLVGAGYRACPESATQPQPGGQPQGVAPTKDELWRI
jgi:REP element-mobilizing transposase RayT